MKRPTIFGVTLVALLYVVVPLVFASKPFVMSLLVAAMTVAGVALAWAMAGNLGGLVSFGHSAFVGIGGYATALLTIKWGLPVFPAMLMGGLAALIAALIMLPMLRLKGPYFALSILAYANIFRVMVSEVEFTGGAGGLTGIPRLPTLWGFDFSSKTGSYVLILTLLLLFMWIYALIRDSHYGLALKAMHESEDATRVVGVNSVQLKAGILLLSAFMTGVFGAFNTHYISFLDPDYAFDSAWIVLPVIAAIFGGYRTLTGPVIGALVMYMVDQLIFKALMPSGHQILLGALLVLMILFSPTGLVPLVFRKGKGHRAAP